jgi:hypothetical protein
VKLYLAGQFQPEHAEGLEDVPGLRFLVSYHYLEARDTRALIAWCEEHGFPLFLDSGAFSSSNMGATIPLEEYVEHCQEWAGRYEVVAALDVIGDPKASRRNWEAMREAGVDCIPTFHVGSPFEELESLARDTDHLALGGIARRVTGRKVATLGWIGKCFKTAQAVNPGVKIHGFGMTSVEVMARFPWHSVDSTRWLTARMFGSGFWRDGARIRVYWQGNQEKVPAYIRDRFLHMGLGDKSEGTKRYGPLLVNNARVFTQWVRDMGEFRSMTGGGVHGKAVGE